MEKKQSVRDRGRERKRKGETEGGGGVVIDGVTVEKVCCHQGLK
jgi:hypothetical protein